MTHEALPELPELPGMPGMPGMPLDADSPVFNEPWEARAFAMVLALHQRGMFTWPQWAAALSRQITLAHAAGDADLGDTYYRHWLLALESLVKDLPIKASPPPP
jgi:nitrile hydratase accessory protein